MDHHLTKIVEIKKGVIFTKFSFKITDTPWACFKKHDGPSDRASDHHPMLFVHSRMVRRWVGRRDLFTPPPTGGVTPHLYNYSPPLPNTPIGGGYSKTPPPSLEWLTPPNQKVLYKSLVGRSVMLIETDPLMLFLMVPSFCLKNASASGQSGPNDVADVVGHIRSYIWSTDRYTALAASTVYCTSTTFVSPIRSRV